MGALGFRGDVFVYLTFLRTLGFLVAGEARGQVDVYSGEAVRTTFLPTHVFTLSVNVGHLLGRMDHSGLYQL